MGQDEIKPGLITANNRRPRLQRGRHINIQLKRIVLSLSESKMNIRFLQIKLAGTKYTFREKKAKFKLHGQAFFMDYEFCHFTSSFHGGR